VLRPGACLATRSDQPADDPRWSRWDCGGFGFGAASARRMPSPIAPAMTVHAATQASRTDGVKRSPRPYSEVRSDAAPTTSKCSGRTP
jgi:hypothetical protein